MVISYKDVFCTNSALFYMLVMTMKSNLHFIKQFALAIFGLVREPSGKLW